MLKQQIKIWVNLHKRNLNLFNWLDRLKFFEWSVKIANTVLAILHITYNMRYNILKDFKMKAFYASDSFKFVLATSLGSWWLKKSLTKGFHQHHPVISGKNFIIDFIFLIQYCQYYIGVF